MNTSIKLVSHTLILVLEDSLSLAPMVFSGAPGLRSWTGMTMLGYANQRWLACGAVVTLVSGSIEIWFLLRDNCRSSSTLGGSARTVSGYLDQFALTNLSF
jgi:hypothetical protein